MSGKLIFFTGLNTGYLHNGEPDSRYIEFYRDRSSLALHCAIVGNVVVPGGYGTNSSTPTITKSKIWADLASAISDQQSVPGIQLATTWEGYRGARMFRSREPSRITAEGKRIANALSRSDVCTILDAFDVAAEIAVNHGFGHLQIHAAHGYLLSLLIDHRISVHSDLVQSRLSKFARIWQIADIETSIRVSLRTGDDAFDKYGREEFYRSIVNLGFDYVDLSSGFYNIDKRLIYPSTPNIVRERREDTLYMANTFSKQMFIGSGRASDILGKDSTPENLHVGICRDLLANARFLSDLQNGCANSGKCHYFSRGKNHISCPRWSDIAS